MLSHRSVGLGDAIHRTQDLEMPWVGTRGEGACETQAECRSVAVVVVTGAMFISRERERELGIQRRT